MLAQQKTGTRRGGEHEIRQIRLAQHTKITMDRPSRPRCTIARNGHGSKIDRRGDNPTYIVVILQQNGTKDTIIKLRNNVGMTVSRICAQQQTIQS